MLRENQHKIHAYILSLVPNFVDAEEILQETIFIMWKKFDQFQLGTNFDSWGVKIAYYNILNYRKWKRKEICFSDTVFGKFTDIAEKKCARIDNRIPAMRLCVKKLDDEDQRLLKARYEWNYSVETIARNMNRSSKFVYKRLAKIVQALYGSVRRTIQEDAP